jgi:hypothetical protein
MSIFKRIVKWNKDRNLIKPENEFNLKNDISFILEELIEMTSDLKSNEARELATNLADLLLSNRLKDFLNEVKFDYKEVSTNKNILQIIESEKIVDAFADIIVFSVGSIRKLNYNPDKVMNEVLKEIESRKGKIINGKFVKDTNPEVVKKWYKANLLSCKI